MGFFSRNKEAVETGRGDDVPFETVRRSPRSTRKNASSGSRFDAGSPLDPAETTRTRARRRLIGAVALALAAVVFVPMLFDRTPSAPPDDIALQLPDRDTPFEGRRGVPDPANGPLVPSTDLPAVTPAAPAAPTPRAASEPAPSPDTGPRMAEAPNVEPAAPKSDRPAVAKAPESFADKTVEKAGDNKAKPATTNAASAPTDDPRAIAALEGRSDVTAAKAADASAGHTYAVQIAAYASPEKARQMRDQLVAGGLRSYVESVSTSEGLRTRVRLGPFPSREAADHARAKLKTMKLDGSVVPL